MDNNQVASTGAGGGDEGNSLVRNERSAGAAAEEEEGDNFGKFVFLFGCWTITEKQAIKRRHGTKTSVEFARQVGAASRVPNGKRRRRAQLFSVYTKSSSLTLLDSMFNCQMLILEKWNSTFVREWSEPNYSWVVITRNCSINSSAKCATSVLCIKVRGLWKLQN